MKTFPERLAEIQQQKKTRLALTIAPRVMQMPMPIAKYDDPFLPFGKAVIDATHDLVCAYLFDLASYLSIGAAGAVALERTIAYAKSEGILTILHGLFSIPDYVESAGAGGFGVDAVTVMRNGQDVALFTAYSEALNEGVIFADQGYASGQLPSVPMIAEFSADRTKISVSSSKLPGSTSQIHVVGNDVLYASQREDFAERVRAALEALR